MAAVRTRPESVHERKLVSSVPEKHYHSVPFQARLVEKTSYPFLFHWYAACPFNRCVSNLGRPQGCRVVLFWVLQFWIQCTKIILNKINVVKQMYGVFYTRPLFFQVDRHATGQFLRQTSVCSATDFHSTSTQHSSVKTLASTSTQCKKSPKFAWETTRQEKASCSKRPTCWYHSKAAKRIHLFWTPLATITNRRHQQRTRADYQQLHQIHQPSAEFVSPQVSKVWHLKCFLNSCLLIAPKSIIQTTPKVSENGDRRYTQTYCLWKFAKGLSSKLNRNWIFFKRRKLRAVNIFSKKIKNA